MKDYPSIPASTGQKFRAIPDCHVFCKLDGSSMRSEWSKKRGWYKHGKRKGLIDHSNPHLIQVPDLFEATMAEHLARIAVNNHWKHLVVFYEFWGTNSIAGLHYEEDPKFLSLFDAAADKKGIMGPRDFRRRFEGQVETARYVGKLNWTRAYVNLVRKGQVDCAFEGVVGKRSDGPHKVVRAKAKTQAWIDKVLEIHGKDVGEKLVNS